MKVKKTARGFEIIEFTDKYGEKCSLQQSSIVGSEQPGATAIWLGCDENGKTHLGEQLSPRMHLDRKQVKEIVKHLKAWLKTGSFKL